MKYLNIKKIVIIILILGGVFSLFCILTRNQEGFKRDDWVGGSWKTSGCKRVKGKSVKNYSLTAKCGDKTTTIFVKDCPRYDDKPYFINAIRGKDDVLMCN